MSASPDNHLRYDLIRRKPENERSASAAVTGRVEPIISRQNLYFGIHTVQRKNARAFHEKNQPVKK